ncbi:MAG: J domain-containing protein, partial [Thermoanaerobaculia bacterium]
MKRSPGPCTDRAGAVCIRTRPPLHLKRPEYQDDLDAGTDYFELLGVPEYASEEEIVSAFRARIRKVHPDVGGEPD